MGGVHREYSRCEVDACRGTENVKIEQVAPYIGSIQGQRGLASTEAAVMTPRCTSHSGMLIAVIAVDADGVRDSQEMLTVAQ